MKVFVITKKHIMMCLSVILSITAITLISAHAFAGSEKKLPIYCVETDKKRVAISFDAAWGNAKKVQNIANSHEISFLHQQYY